MVRIQHLIQWGLAPAAGLAFAIGAQGQQAAPAPAQPGTPAPAAAAPEPRKPVPPEDDGSGNEVRYAVLGFGGWMGLGQEHFAYPLEVLELAPARDTVILRVTREQLEQAPGFDARQLPDWNAYLAQVDRFWAPALGAGRTAPAAARAWTAPEHVPPGVAPSPVPRPGIGAAQPIPPRIPDEVRRMEAITADDLIGRGIRDRQGQHIGHLRDIIADFDTGDIEFAVAALDRGWLEADRLATLPMDVFRRDPRFVRDVVLDMSRQALAQAPTFHADRWPQFEEQDFRTAWERFVATIRPGQ